MRGSSSRWTPTPTRASRSSPPSILALDPQAIEALVRIRDGISAGDAASDYIACLWNLARLEANPDVVQRFVQRAAPRIAALDDEGRWPHFAYWIARFGELAVQLRETRPDVADVIAGLLAQFSTIERARRLVALAAHGPEGRAAADTIILALGAGIGPALAAVAQSRGTDGRDGAARTAQQLLYDHAALVAPAVAAVLPEAEPSAARALVRVLGRAGAGYEPVVAARLQTGDEPTAREALRSLARMATPSAAAAVGAAVDQPASWLATAAAETLWHFPPAEARREVLSLLGRRAFVARQPAVAARLLERTAQHGTGGLETVLQALMPLEYRVWRPSLARVGRRAYELQKAAA